MSQRTTPPFRADHVGSLLRPAALKKAREQRVRGEITPAQLKDIEDREIERVIKKQEEVGLQSITDGEFRRSWWHLDFLWGLDGIEKHDVESLMKKLEAADIAFARVNDWELLSKHAHLRRITVGAPSGPVTMPAPAPLRAGQARTYGPIPALGEHTEMVRKEFLP